jgi:hypothetical protein
MARVAQSQLELYGGGEWEEGEGEEYEEEE